MDSVLEPLVSELKVVDKKIGVVPLIPNWAQKEYLAAVEKQLRTTGKIRLIVLKARQLGISTITEALLFVLCFLIPRYKGLVVTHEVKASQNLLNMTQFYWDSYPYRPLYTTKFQSRNDIVWRETGSSISIDTAGKKGGQGVGRSSTVHFVHASEAAFWDDPESVMLGLRQTIPNAWGTGIVIESTANGVGNWFQHTWNRAIAGENEYIPLFFPWWKHPEYVATHANLPNPMLLQGDLDSDERSYRNMGVDDDHLNWRRWAVSNMCNGDVLQFKQEYPATPEEAFIASGLNIFDYECLTKCFVPEDGIKGEIMRDGERAWFEARPNGRLTIFRAPDPKNVDWADYMVGADPTRTTIGDYACAQVFNRRTLEQVAVWRGKIDAATFAEELFRIGLFYQTATICPEITGPGSTTIGALLGMNYPRVWQRARPDTTPGKFSSEIFGWSTTVQSKHLAIGALIKSTVDGDLVLHDRITFQELRDYVTLENGTMGPADPNNGHDDTVMALAIGIAAHRLENPFAAYRPTSGDVQPNYDNNVAPWDQ